MLLINIIIQIFLGYVYYSVAECIRNIHSNFIFKNLGESEAAFEFFFYKQKVHNNDTKSLKKNICIFVITSVRSTYVLEVEVEVIGCLQFHCKFCTFFILQKKKKKNRKKFQFSCFV